MGEDRVVVVSDHGPRRPRRRRRGLIATHVAVLASIVLTSGALAPAFAGEHRSGHRCHRGEGRYGAAPSGGTAFSY